MKKIVDRLDKVASTLEGLGMQAQAAALDSVANTLENNASTHEIQDAAKKIVMRGNLAEIMKKIRDAAASHGAKNAIDSLILSAANGHGLSQGQVKEKIDEVANALQSGGEGSERKAFMDALMSDLPIHAIGVAGSIAAVLTALGAMITAGVGSGEEKPHMGNVEETINYLKEREYDLAHLREGHEPKSGIGMKEYQNMQDRAHAYQRVMDQIHGSVPPHKYN